MLGKTSGNRAVTGFRHEPNRNTSTKAAGYCYIRKVTGSRADLKARA